MTTNTLPQNKSDRSNDKQQKSVNSPKQLTKPGSPANNVPRKPVANATSSHSHQSFTPKKPINNKGEETLDASIHAHVSWADEFEHDFR